MLCQVESLIIKIINNRRSDKKKNNKRNLATKVCLVFFKLPTNRIMLKSLSVLTTADITPTTDTDIQNPSATTTTTIHKKQIKDFATSTTQVVANQQQLQQQSLLVLHLNKNQYNGALETNCYEISSSHQQLQSPTHAAQQLQQLLQQQQQQQQQNHTLLQIQHQQLLLQHQQQSNEQSISTANQTMFDDDDTDMQQHFTSCFKHKGFLHPSLLVMHMNLKPYLSKPGTRGLPTLHNLS